MSEAERKGTDMCWSRRRRVCFGTCQEEGKRGLLGGGGWECLRRSWREERYEELSGWRSGPRSLRRGLMRRSLGRWRTGMGWCAYHESHYVHTTLLRCQCHDHYPTERPILGQPPSLGLVKISRSEGMKCCSASNLTL